MKIKFTDAIKQEIVKCLLEDWSEKDIGIKFNIASNYLRKIARANGINRVIKDDKAWKVPKPKIQKLKIEFERLAVRKLAKYRKILKECVL